ncbi:hypothetical protein OAP18_00085 [Gammaproteobacteria bacterium]|nr:hypothetical protein [Gammaproteobacteria bacterium]
MITAFIRLFPYFARLDLRTNGSALLLSVALLYSLVVIVRSAGELNPPEIDTIEIRKVELARPPPSPPPPPATRQQTQAPSLELNLAGTGPVLELNPTFRKDVVLTSAPQPVFETLSKAWENDLNIDWSAFGLADLDAPPQVLTLQKVTYPEELSRRNISRVIVRLDIFINENGQARLINISENPHPELIPAIRQLVQSVRFSKPTKNGQAVQARFIWPVEIQE